MTPDQLLTFAVVAELGSISRAADALHLSQPAVSGQLRLLQDAFAQPLYRRVGRGIQLTPAGEELAGLSRQLRQTYDRARWLREAMAGLQTGSVMIGASTTPASYLLPYQVADFRSAYPTINVALSSGNTADITEHLSQFDLAFIEGAVPQDLPPHTDVHEWVRDEVVAVVRSDHPLVQLVQDTPSESSEAAPPIAASGPAPDNTDRGVARASPRGSRANDAVPPASASAVPGEDNQPPQAASHLVAPVLLQQSPLPQIALWQLAKHPLVMREAGSGVRNQVTQAFVNADLPMQIAIELAGVEGVLEGVRAGLGIGFVSAMAVRHTGPQLQAFAIKPPHRLSRHISVLVPHAQSLSTAAKAFLERCLPPE